MGARSGPHPEPIGRSLCRRGARQLVETPPQDDDPLPEVGAGQILSGSEMLHQRGCLLDEAIRHARDELIVGRRAEIGGEAVDGEAAHLWV